MITKLLNKILVSAVVLCCVWAMSSCKAGLTYEEAPESVYSEVGVTNFTLKARELFTDKIYAVNWHKWVDNYIDTRLVGAMGEWKWTNLTGKDYTLPDGTVVADGQEVTIPGQQIVEESKAELPGGKLYVINVNVFPRVTYYTPNKGYLFDQSKFSGDFRLINPKDNRSTAINMPIKKNELIGELYLADWSICNVEPLDGSTPLGKPGDFTKANRYIVMNIAHRPAGVEQVSRVYEVRVNFLP